MSLPDPIGEAGVPEHVPESLIWNRSFEEFNHEMDDPFLAASRLHEGPDIIWSPNTSHYRPGWILTRQVHIWEALNDYEHFSSENGSGLSFLLGRELRPVPLDYDPPEHTLYRRWLNPFFTPRQMEKMEGPVRKVCDDLIAEFEDSGGCEFISQFAIPFPTYIFLALVGLPIEEAEQFLKWEEHMLRSADFEERRTAAVNVYDYLLDFVKAQRQNPTTELLEGMLNSSIGGRTITDEELLGTMFTFYLGGLDTVYSTLGWIMRELANNQELQKHLGSNLDLLPRAVGEFSRAFSVVSTHRVVAKDVTFNGVFMKQGDIVLTPLFLAGRDPKAHENPHQIDLNRQSPRLTFASGPHTCLGIHLARREMKIALESFLTRFRNIRIPAGESYRYHAAQVFGVDRLPLEWDR